MLFGLGKTLVHVGACHLVVLALAHLPITGYKCRDAVVLLLVDLLYLALEFLGLLLNIVFALHYSSTDQLFTQSSVFLKDLTQLRDSLFFHHPLLDDGVESAIVLFHACLD